MEIDIKEPIEYICESYYYLIDGKKFWRVTQVKSVLNQAGLNAWRAKVGNSEANKIMKTRQTLGTKVHKLIELMLKGHKVNKDNYDNPEVKEDIDLTINVIKDCELEAISLEQHLWSDRYRIAGTADYLGYYKSNSKYLPRVRGTSVKPKFNEKSFVIGDWKTSAGIYRDYWLQLSAYVFMLEELTGIRAKGAFIAQLRDGKVTIEERTYDELKPFFEAFKHCIACFEYQKKEGIFENAK